MSRDNGIGRLIARAKHSSMRVLSQAGVSSLVGRGAWRRRRLLILCYHGIALGDEHLWDPGLYVPLDQFRRRLQQIERRRCHVLPLGEAVERLYRHDLPERAVVLTFDDGYYDFLGGAWPALRDHGFPATVYLTTARVARNLPIVHLLLSYQLWCRRHTRLPGAGVPGLENREYPLRTAAQRSEVVRRVIGAARANEANRSKDAVAGVVAERLGFDYADAVQRRLLTLLNADEVRQLAAEGVDFQLHTHVHRTPPDAMAFVRDVMLNRERISSLTGRDPTHLCYPSGDYRLSYLPVLREHGIRSATTCNPGIASPGSERLLLPRFVDTGSVSDDVFENWLTGLAAWLPRRTRRGGTGEGTSTREATASSATSPSHSRPIATGEDASRTEAAGAGPFRSTW